jgi:drug/metabolite transporter superfamily protein YnfA
MDLIFVLSVVEILGCFFAWSIVRINHGEASEA